LGLEVDFFSTIPPHYTPAPLCESFFGHGSHGKQGNTEKYKV